MSHSQPVVDDDSPAKSKNPLKRTLSEPGGRTQNKRYTMSRETKDHFLDQFNDWFKRIPDDDQGFITAEIESNNIRSAHIFYFIGRLNPPHNGHIEALKKLVEDAKKKGANALILLGSGPTKGTGAGRRTMDDPIEYALKKEFIESKLPAADTNGKVSYIIQEMTTPFKDVTRHISDTLKSMNNIKKIYITHMAGGKDDDATKLNGVLKFGSQVASEQVPSAEIFPYTDATGPPPAAPGETPMYMSATNVRKFAYLHPFEKWAEKYGTFYGAFAERIYNEIHFPLNGLTEEAKKEAIRKYINPPTREQKTSTGKKSPTGIKSPTERKSSRRQTSKKTGGGKKRRKSKMRRIK